MLRHLSSWSSVASDATAPTDVAAIAAALIVAALGFVLERGVFRFTLTRPMNGFIVSLGLIVLLQHVAIRVWNSTQKSIPDPVGVVWQIGEVRIEPVEVLVNQCLIARGEVVVVEGNYGVRILEIASRQERIRSLR